MRRSATPEAPRRVSLVAVPEAGLATLSGLHDVLLTAGWADLSGRPNGPTPFTVEIVGEAVGPLGLASGVPLPVTCAIADVEATDIVIIPSLMVSGGTWRTGRHPALVEWLRRVHDRGATLCSACSGIFLLAETGRFDGRDATVHFQYADAFARTFPRVRVHAERVLVVSGARDELVCSGASTSWHDLALYLIARFAGAAAALDVARMFALQWHQDGLAPFMVFQGRRDHGDPEILGAQEWLDTHFSVAHPVEEMQKRSRLAARTFKRRFSAATGHTPVAFVQRLRVEEAKRRLERTDTSIEEISWQVGYEDPAFFRRLFKRTTGLAPGAYRRRFRLPQAAPLGRDEEASDR